MSLMGWGLGWRLKAVSGGAISRGTILMGQSDHAPTTGEFVLAGTPRTVPCLFISFGESTPSGCLPESKSWLPSVAQTV